MANGETASPAPVQTSIFSLAEAGLSTEGNAVRIHDERNLSTIDDSVDETGYLRGIVLDEENNVLCGKGLVTVAEKRGGANIVIVDVYDDNTIIATRKHGLDERQKKRAMLWDNRASDLSRDNKKEIGRLADSDQLLLEGIYTEREQQKLLRMQADTQPLSAGGSESEEGADPEIDTGAGRPAQSSIRVISIFATTETQPELVRKIKKLGSTFFGTNVITESLIALINRTYHDWIEAPAEAQAATKEEAAPSEDSSNQGLPL